MRKPPPAPAPPRGPSQRNLFAVQRSASGQMTLEGEVTRISFENEQTGFRVLRISVDGEPGERTLVGVFPPALPGSRVRATGNWVKDAKRGEQLRVETLLTVAPATMAGLERFLGSGLVRGVGPAFAKRIVESFGEETLDVLDNHPDRLREVAGLGKERASEVQKAWESHRAVGAIMIFLQTHGASPALASRIYKRFGAKAVSIVTRSPYRLALDVWGVGFKTADRIASSLGIGKDSPERAQAGALHLMHERAGQGHTASPRGPLAEAAAQMLELDLDAAERAIDSLAAQQRVVIEPGDDDALVLTVKLETAERTVAERIARLLAAPAAGAVLDHLVPKVIDAFEAHKSVVLADGQRAALELLATSKVCVVTGGPGVGKTTIVRAVLELFDRAGLVTRLAAPTGRAAKRMAETTSREAVTLHRLLEFDPKTATFARGEEKPLDLTALIVDESSMIDVELCAALLSAVPDGARVVFVGDVDQLPSVGPGAVLRDVITSNVVPTARLSVVFRQKEGSGIIENAHRIHDGEAPISERGADGQFFVIEKRNDEACAQTLIEVVTTRIPKTFGLDPTRDVQVLTPMHRGAVGTQKLNEQLQEALNPNGPSVKVGPRTMRLGDKVMQLKNDYEREVYNGDVGIVSRLDQETKKLMVRFDDREVAYDEGDLDELVLAYATSIHKSQGSEYPAVVIPLLMNHFVMLSRNLLYTAVTRGKRLVILIADPRAISLSLAEIRKGVRQTLLSERLRSAVGF